MTPQEERAQLMAECRAIGLARIQAFGPFDVSSMPDHFLRVGPGWSTREMDQAAHDRLASWHSDGADEIDYLEGRSMGFSPQHPTGRDAHSSQPPAPRRVVVDVAVDATADQTVHPFESPQGERTQHQSTSGVSAVDDTLPNAACHKTPLSFTASLETEQLPIQGQLFDPAATGSRP